MFSTGFFGSKRIVIQKFPGSNFQWFQLALYDIPDDGHAYIEIFVSQDFDLLCTHEWRISLPEYHPDISEGLYA